MKNLMMFLLIIMTLTVFPTSSFAYTYQNEPDGFREIKWGTDFETVKDQLMFASLDESYGGIKVYTKINDEMNIGTASLESVEYCFWQNKFVMAYINVLGINNWLGVQDALKYKFGQGFKSNRFIEDYTWVGNTTIINSKYSDIERKGTIIFISWNLHHQMEAWDAKQAAEGAKKGF